MQKSNIALGLALVAVVIAIGGYFYPQIQSFGAGTRYPNGISADSTSPTAGQVRGTTFTSTGAATFGGDVTITTSNTATSTLTVGCIQMYATSTATSLVVVPATYATTSLAFDGTTAGLPMVAFYGTCPN